VAFDAEIAAIEGALEWYLQHLVIHSDSTSAIARASYFDTGHGQRPAKGIRTILHALEQEGRTAEIQWVKGHAGTMGNERADLLTDKAAEKTAWSPFTSLAYLKLRVSEKFRTANDEWHKNPDHHGSEEIPPPPAKKSCLDWARNSIARIAAQIRTGHWRSAVYLKRIKKRRDDKCWFCRGRNRMARSHVLLHCPNAKIRAARGEAREGKDLGSVRVLLSNPRWERRLLGLLELSGVVRVMVGPGSEAGRMDYLGGGGVGCARALD
jgi:hypothetical protein